MVLVEQIYTSCLSLASYYIESDGSDTPYRLKMRSPAFTALGVLNEIAGGWLMADVLAILGSLDIVLGEIDR